MRLLSLLGLLTMLSGPVRVASVSAQLGGGRDLGITCASSWRTFLFFGDTFSSPASGNGPVMTDWRPLTGAFSTDRDPSDGLTLQPLAGDGALLIPAAGAATITPTGCIVAGGAIYLRYMETVSNAGHDFQIDGAGIATSTDGERWTKHPLWPGDTALAQAALVDGRDGFVYALSSEGGRTGPAVLARVRPDQLAHPASYRFWDGATWQPDPARAAVVIDDAVGELSVCWSDVDWLAVYMSPRANGIVLRRAPALTGPWSDAELLLPWDGDTYGTYAPMWWPGACGRDFLLSTFRDYEVSLWQLE